MRVRAGGTIGILGGGHSSRMMALAARRLGFRPRILELDRIDIPLAASFAEDCDAVTVATEDVHPDVLAAVAVRTRLRPSLQALTTAQDRLLERRWLQGAGLPTLPMREAASREEISAAVAAFRAPCVVKPQRRVRHEVRPIWVMSMGEAAAAWNAMRGAPVIVEPSAPIVSELSVLVARSARGELRTYPPAASIREHSSLAWTVLPGRLSGATTTQARDVASRVADALGIEGLLAVELFVLSSGDLVVNEIVPAPHATFHGTELACGTDQFEQAILAVAGLPLGSTEVVRPTATVTVRTTRHDAETALDRALRVSGVRAYFRDGGSEAVGHVSAAGETEEEATIKALLSAGEVDRRHARRVNRLRRTWLAPA